MTAPAAEGAIADAATGLPMASGSVPNINPLTGLSTDYLNHFTEAVMALEMAASMPECLDDLRAWGPKSYVEHFAASRFSHRATAIGAYRSADGTTRTAVDAAAAVLNAAILEVRDAVLADGGSAAIDDEQVQRACEAIRPRIAGLAALINGATAAGRDSGSTQSEIDDMFGR